MDLPTRSEFYRDHLAPFRILPGAPQFADIGICVVCQENFNEASYDMVAIRSCSHVFHRNCLIRWTESWGLQRHTCPSCRTAMYQYVPMTKHEIEDMLEAQALQDAEGQGLDQSLRAAAIEAERLWLESVGTPAEGWSDYEEELEPELMDDSEYETPAALVEIVAAVADPRSSPPALFIAHPDNTPEPPVEVGRATDPGDSSPAYPPSTPSYRAVSPELYPFGSPTYAPNSPLRPTAPGPTSPSRSLHGSPPFARPPRSPPNAPDESRHTNQGQVNRIRQIISCDYRIMVEIPNVVIVSHARPPSSNVYRAILAPTAVDQGAVISQDVYGATGYVMVGRTAIFYV